VLGFIDVSAMTVVEIAKPTTLKGCPYTFVYIVYGRMLLIYYSSAFNTIVPFKLITKLRTVGLNTSLCIWILDFLTGHPQMVRVGNNTSATVTFNTGAPQGCVLSPLLYSLFTHDCVAAHDSQHRY
jgi:hypothetical protein